MTARQVLGVIFGGPSVEHTISLRSARAVIAAADPNRWRVAPFAVTRSGSWLSTGDSAALLRRIERGAAEEALASAETLNALGAAAELSVCDAVFPLVHGAWGEDGALQGFLETLGLPYVGSGVAASSLAMNKAAAKPVFQAAGIDTAPGFAIRRADWQEHPLISEREAIQLGCPLFVKPAAGGSSIGVSRVESREELAGAFAAAFDCGDTVLVERAMPNAREIECAVLGGERLRASGLGEIRTARDFYDYTAKYEDPATGLIIPAELESSLASRIRKAALAACAAVGAYGMARADFLLGDGGELWLGELNTIPGFTSVSMYPLLWAACGVPLPALVDQLVALAFERPPVDGPHR